MTNMDYTALAERQKKQAFEIIEKLKITDIWQQAGARINLVGSLKIGVLAKHRDIDFHIYTNMLDIEQSFAAMARICTNPAVKKCEFTNLAQTEEACFEWHIWVEDRDKNLWQIDMIQILSGSQYDGYFESVAADIAAAMTEENRKTILKLKFETPDNLKIGGIEYYKAVIQDGITTFDDFIKWRAKQNFNGIIEW